MEYIHPGKHWAFSFFRLVTPGKKNVAAAPSAFMSKAGPDNQQQVPLRGMKAAKCGWRNDRAGQMIKITYKAIKKNPKM